MDYVETEGNSIDEAIENALKALGVERAKAEIEILSSATRGLFGIGGKKARVRASRRQPVDWSAAPAAAGEERPVTRMREPAPEAPPPRAQAAVPPDPVRSAETEAMPALTPPPSVMPQAGESAARARALLEDLIARMGFTAAVDVSREEDTTVLTIKGESSGILIGRRGQTLDAIEYVLNRMVGRDDEKGARIAVDCEEYREKRRQSLEEMALRMAERARRRGKAVTLNPMSPRDRRVVHLALQGDATLTTRSSGRGYYRRLVIIPEADRRALRGQ